MYRRPPRSTRTDHLFPYTTLFRSYNSGILAHGVKGPGPFHYEYQPASPEIVGRVAAIEALCDTHGVPLAAAALQFPLAHPQVASVIPGMNSAARVVQAVALAEQALPAAFWADLRAAGLIRADAPPPASPAVRRDGTESGSTCRTRCAPY